MLGKAAGAKACRTYLCTFKRLQESKKNLDIGKLDFYNSYPTDGSTQETKRLRMQGAHTSPEPTLQATFKTPTRIQTRSKVRANLPPSLAATCDP